MPQIIQPYVNPDTIEHHNTRHAVDGLDELTPAMIGISDLEVLPIELGGTGVTTEDDFNDLVVVTSAKIETALSETPLSVAAGGTGFWGFTGETNDAPLGKENENIGKIRSFANMCLKYALDEDLGGTPLAGSLLAGGGAGGADLANYFSSFKGWFWWAGDDEQLLENFMVGSELVRTIRAYCSQVRFGGSAIGSSQGGTGFLGWDIADIQELEGEEWEDFIAENEAAGLLFFDEGITKVLTENPLSADLGGTGKTTALTAADIGAASATHAAAHKTGGADAIAPADIGAASATHAAAHKTGGADAIAPADIGAADSTHTHSGYLTASFNATTHILSIGGNDYDLTTLLVP